MVVFLGMYHIRRCYLVRQWAHAPVSSKIFFMYDMELKYCVSSSEKNLVLSIK